MAIEKAIGRALERASRTIRKQREREIRSNRPRSYYVYSTRVPFRQAVFAELPKAIDHATGGGKFRVSARTLFYAIRPLIQKYDIEGELEYGYFSQTLLTEYQRSHGKIRELYYDPRGMMREPHSDRMIMLGTLEVEGYEFPSWLYNKILY